jgi:hypothetical protein
VLNLLTSPLSADNQSTFTSSSAFNLSTSPFLAVNPPTSSQSLFINLSNSSSTNSSFRNELINQRLRSYFLMYENSSQECKISIPLTNKQNQSYSAILKSLDSLRQQIVPYPNEYFYGRGIVLTVGLKQLKYAKANLKMLELSNTRLPVQVNRYMNQSFIIFSCLDLVFI